MSETKDYLGMSDEDFLNINAPAEDETEEQSVPPGSESETPETPEAQNAAETPEPAGSEPVADAAAGTAAEPGEDGDDESVSAGEPQQADPAEPGAAAQANDKDAAQKPEGGQAKDVKPGDKKEPEAEAKPVDYEAFFKQVMAPFKANGRTIELKSPEEAIRLMQMGAGYGRKLHDLQPHLKVLRMLEKNDLLDESKLSFLIDVNQKNPDAVKKLIKDSGIDPLDINPEDNVDYIPKNHSVSDQEMAFQEALADIQSQPSGNETLRVINSTWDDTSKFFLGKNPQVLSVIQEQRDNGIYDQIVAEIDRQKLLGQIPLTTPFLEAYQTAGKAIEARGGFKAPEGQIPQHQLTNGLAPQPQPQVIATRPAQPKAQVANSDRARAASSTQATTRKAAPVVNPLDMADDDFLKQFGDRFR